jgi:hypothetical protein
LLVRSFAQILPLLLFCVDRLIGISLQWRHALSSSTTIVIRTPPPTSWAVTIQRAVLLCTNGIATLGPLGRSSNRSSAAAPTAADTETQTRRMQGQPYSPFSLPFFPSPLYECFSGLLLRWKFTEPNTRRQRGLQLGPNGQSHQATNFRGGFRGVIFMRTHLYPQQ